MISFPENFGNYFWPKKKKKQKHDFERGLDMAKNHDQIYLDLWL